MGDAAIGDHSVEQGQTFYRTGSQSGRRWWPG